MSTLSRGTETSQMDPASADIEAGPSRGSATDIELSKMSPPPLDIVTSAATPAETPAETPTETNRYIQQRHDLSKQAAPLYQQWTLPENRKCIRLLTIKAPDPSHPDGGPLEASMSVEDVDNGTSFAALSYVWGAWSSKNPPHTILCEEYPIPITPNCFSALRHLRHQLDKFTVWVDAICIDQENEKEKLHQIPLMRDIYSRAKVSYMWLGKGNDKTDRAMSWLGMLVDPLEDRSDRSSSYFV